MYVSHSHPLPHCSYVIFLFFLITYHPTPITSLLPPSPFIRVGMPESSTMASHSPSQVSLHRLHGDWLASLTRPPSTILSSQKSLLSTILALSPSTLSDKVSTPLFLNIALLHAFHGSLALAATTFEEAIARSPHCALAQFGLGLTRFLQARDVDAIQAWKACAGSFEVMTPEGIQGGEWVGTNNISYQMWKPSEYGEDQRGHQGGVEKEESNEHRRGWVLAKDAVLWNLYVAEQRWEETMNAVYRRGKNTDINENIEMLFVKGIPAGMLFGPPSELRQEVHVQSKEASGRNQKGPTENTDLIRANAHTDNHASTREGSVSAVTQMAPVFIQDLGPSTSCKDHSIPELSSVALKIANDGQYLTAHHDRGRSPAALFQGDLKAVYTEHRANAIAFRPAVNFPMGNSQGTMLPLSRDKRRPNRSRTLDDAAPSSTAETKKPLPPLPGRLTGLPNLASGHNLPPPQPPPTLIHPRTLSTKASSLARFFTKSKHGRRSRSTNIRTDADADAGADPDAGVDASRNFASFSSTPRGFLASRTSAPFSDNIRGKGKVFRPRRPVPPTVGFSVQGSKEDHPSYAASAEADMKPRLMGISLPDKTEWEKNMERRVADEMKTPKRLYFPREEINRKPVGGSGIGLGLGSSYKEGGTMTIIPSQNQNQSRPVPLPIPHTAPVTAAEFDQGSTGGGGGISREDRPRVLIFNDQGGSSIGAANSAPRNTARPRTKTVPYSNLDGNYHPPGAALSVPAFPKRTSSLTPIGLSSSAPPYPLPPPQQRQQRQQHQQRGRPLSHLGLELEWDDEKGDFRVRQEEGKESRDNSCSCSSRTRTQDQSDRLEEANEADTMANITPLESRSQIPLHLPNHSYNGTSANSIHEQNTPGLNSGYPTSISHGLENEGNADRNSKRSIQDGVESDQGHDGVHGRGSASGMTTDEKKAEEESAEQLGLLSSAAFPGFGGGVAGQWYGGKWV